MDQAVGCRSCPRSSGLNPRSAHVGFVVDKMALGAGFSPSTWVSRCQYHASSAPSTYSFTCCSYRKDKIQKLGTLQRAMLSRKSG